MEGNGGADYIRLEQVSEDELILEVGACCVVTCRHKVPVEFLTQLLSQMGIERGKEYINFDHEEFNAELLSKIERVR